MGQLDILIPESFILTAGALNQAKFAFGGLIVDEKQMAKNLDLSRGLIVAEAVMMGLAPHIGRQQAHDVVYDACRTVNETGGSLSETLVANPEISDRIDQATIDRLTAPRNYLGQARQMVVSRHRSASGFLPAHRGADRSRCPSC